MEKKGVLCGKVFVQVLSRIESMCIHILQWNKVKNARVEQFQWNKRNIIVYLVGWLNDFINEKV